MRRAIARALAVIAMTLSGMGQTVHAQPNAQPKLSHLPSRFGPDLDAGTFWDKQQALADTVDEYLRGDYCIADQRSVKLEAGNLEWVTIGQVISGDVQNHLGGHRVRQDHHRPGYDLVVTWELPDTPGMLVAAAILEEALPGKAHLLSYFELRKLSDVGKASALCPP